MIKDLYDLEILSLNNNKPSCDFLNYLKNYSYPWEILNDIGDIIIKLGSTLDETYIKRDNNIWISKSATLDDFVKIEGPCIIFDDANIKCFTNIRGNVIVGKGSSIGTFCEVKNSILLGNTILGHYNYVGDSILGFNVHLGAQTVLSNLKLDNSNIIINDIDTKRRKVGAFLGDSVNVGCSCVLNPGVMVGKRTFIYPLNNVRGIIKEDFIYKSFNNIVKKRP